MSNPTDAGAVWPLVAAREIRTRLREKSYLVSTGILLVLVVGSIVLSQLLGGRPPSYDVAVAGSAGARLAHAAQQDLRQQSGELDARVTVHRVRTAAAARAAVRAGDVDAALLPAADGFTALGKTEVPAELAAATRAALGRTALGAAADRAGTTVGRLLAGSTLAEHATDPTDVDQGAADAAGFVMSLLFYVAAVGFGMAIAQSVVLEKENRIVEILAAAVPVRALLWGKVAGNTVLALGQIAVVAVCAVAAQLAVGATDGLPDLGTAAAWFLAFFVVGFLALAALWSVAGSVATRQEDLQATTAPGQALLFIPYIIAATGGDLATKIASFVPVASSMTMPGRVAHGDVPFWQPALSLTLSILAGVLLVRLGAGWYERTLLQTSRRTPYRELLRGGRGSTPQG
jgi:ABC-2 type transport system permease protein